MQSKETFSQPLILSQELWQSITTRGTSHNLSTAAQPEFEGTLSTLAAIYGAALRCSSLTPQREEAPQQPGRRLPPRLHLRAAAPQVHPGGHVQVTRILPHQHLLLCLPLLLLPLLRIAWRTLHILLQSAEPAQLGVLLGRVGRLQLGSSA